MSNSDDFVAALFNVCLLQRTKATEEIHFKRLNAAANFFKCLLFRSTALKTLVVRWHRDEEWCLWTRSLWRLQETTSVHRPARLFARIRCFPLLFLRGRRVTEGEPGPVRRANGHRHFLCTLPSLVAFLFLQPTTPVAPVRHPQARGTRDVGEIRGQWLLPGRVRPLLGGV